MHGNNPRKLPVYLSLPRTSKMSCFFFISITVFSSTKSENKRVEQILPREGEGKTGISGRGEM
jgi:hypothetical protein